MRPCAVVFGGAYDQQSIDAVRTPALIDKSATPPIVWLVHAKIAKPRAIPFDKTEYAGEVGARIKQKLDKLKDEGKLDKGDDGMYVY